MSASAPPDPPSGDFLYFFPLHQVTEKQMRRILGSGDPEERAWVISHLLRYAVWEDIWRYVDRDEVRDAFASLELPPKLRSAWARMLKIETPVV